LEHTVLFYLCFEEVLECFDSFLFDLNFVGTSSFVSFRYQKNWQIKALFRFRFDIDAIPSVRSVVGQGGQRLLILKIEDVKFNDDIYTF